MLARGRVAALLTLALFWCGRADAGEATALYQAYWAGLPAGEIRLTLHDDAALYSDRITISTTGLPQLVTRFHGVATSEGALAPGHGPVPRRYEARYDLRKSRDRRLIMQFASVSAGSIAERGPGDTSKKPPLAEKFRTNVLDPLSALNAIRDELRRGARSTFSVPVYDGARRFDVRVRVQPRKPGDSARHLELTLAPIAGFKGETSEDGDPDDAPRPVDLTISDDDRLMPLRMRVSLYYMPLVVEMIRWCKSATECGA
jgi:hypothetical protein